MPPSPATKPNPEITFFTRQDCHLCDSALFALRHALAAIQHDSSRETASDTPRKAITVELVDIDLDRRYFDAYDHHVPVICVNGREVCRHRFDREKLLAALQP